MFYRYCLFTQLRKALDVFNNVVGTLLILVCLYQGDLDDAGLFAGYLMVYNAIMRDGKKKSDNALNPAYLAETVAPSDQHGSTADY